MVHRPHRRAGDEMNLNLHAHEVRCLLDSGECLIVRPVKKQPERFPGHTDQVHEVRLAVWRGACLAKPPFGPPGTRLVGREKWAWVGGRDGHVVYAADEPTAVESKRWCSSSQMEKQYSRLSPVVVSVDVRRVQTVTEAEALAAGWKNDFCADLFSKAAGRHKLRDHSWLETDGGQSVDGDFCAQCARKKLEPGLRLCGCPEVAGDSDGAFCDECGEGIFVSLSEYGITRELRMESESDNDKSLYPVSGGNAQVLATIAGGIGDLREKHLGRLAQIGMATDLERRSKGGWSSNPWAWMGMVKRERD